MWITFWPLNLQSQWSVFSCPFAGKQWVASTAKVNFSLWKSFWFMCFFNYPYIAKTNQLLHLPICLHHCLIQHAWERNSKYFDCLNMVQISFISLPSYCFIFFFSCLVGAITTNVEILFYLDQFKPIYFCLQTWLFKIVRQN